MANHKKKKRRGSAVCGLCKPHKKPGCKKPRVKRTEVELAGEGGIVGYLGDMPMTIEKMVTDEQGMTHCIVSVPCSRPSSCVVMYDDD